jgi:hypothetical protein
VFTLITVDGTVFIPQHKTFFLIAKGTLPELQLLAGSRIRSRPHCESAKGPGIGTGGLTDWFKANGEYRLLTRGGLAGIDYTL